MAEDYYQILGIPRNATQDEIKKAYRKLAMRHHPDKNSGSRASEKKFKEMNNAYDVLSDENKRTIYDYDLYRSSNNDKTEEKQEEAEDYAEYSDKSYSDEPPQNKETLLENITFAILEIARVMSKMKLSSEVLNLYSIFIAILLKFINLAGFLITIFIKIIASKKFIKFIEIKNSNPFRKNAGIDFVSRIIFLVTKALNAFMSILIKSVLAFVLVGFVTVMAILINNANKQNIPTAIQDANIVEPAVKVKEPTEKIEIPQNINTETTKIVENKVIDQLVESAKLCTKQLQRYETEYNIPAHLLSAIAMTESGRYHKGLKISLPYPWAVKVDGKTHFYDSKEQAVAVTKGMIRDGNHTIYVGCMQLSLDDYPQSISTLEQAFEPENNISYAANILHDSYIETGSWKNAVALYNTRTLYTKPNYVKLVYNNWFKIVDKLRANRWSATTSVPNKDTKTNLQPVEPKTKIILLDSKLIDRRPANAPINKNGHNFIFNK